MSDPTTAPLSWSLVVATYRRPQVLIECIRLALAQTRPPLQIIVVDADENWQSTRSAVSALFAAEQGGIELIYEPAAKRSLTCQRNQGLDACRADVAFLLDDDSLMYPDCAAQIMAVYEADAEGDVAGVQASLRSAPPQSLGGQMGAKPNLGAVKASGRVRHRWLNNAVTRWINREVFLMDRHKLFIPYDGRFHIGTTPPGIAGLRAAPVSMFHGCRMTFRTSIIRQVRFDEMMMSYAAGEDLDASYRASQRGLLLEASDAGLHHYESSSGRLSRTTVAALSLLNLAVCVRKHAQDVAWGRRQVRGLTRRRLFAELLKDVCSRRWSLPGWRGIRLARRYLNELFATPTADLAHWYPQLQEQICRTGQA